LVATNRSLLAKKRINITIIIENKRVGKVVFMQANEWEYMYGQSESNKEIRKRLIQPMKRRQHKACESQQRYTVCPNGVIQSAIA
jgi:hypothetical protein